MDIKNLLEKTYELFLILEIFDKESPIIYEIEELIENEQYEKAIRYFLFILMFKIYNYTIFENIRDKELNDCILLMHDLDKYEFINEKIIKKFIEIIYRISLYLIYNKIDFITNNEKKEMVKSKLREISILIKE